MSIIDNIKIYQNFGEEYEFEKEIQDDGIIVYDDIEDIWQMTREELKEKAKQEAKLIASCLSDSEKIAVIKYEDTIKGYQQIGDALPDGWQVEEINEEKLITVTAIKDEETAKFIMDKDGKWYQKIAELPEKYKDFDIVQIWNDIKGRLCVAAMKEGNMVLFTLINENQWAKGAIGGLQHTDEKYKHLID